MKRLLAALACIVLAGCAQLVPAPERPPEADRAAAESAWARALERSVDEHGRVDFAGLERDRADLDRFVSWVYSVGPNNRPELFPSRAEVVAYHINAYNALAMYNVIAAGTPRSLSEYGLIRFFYSRRVAVGGETMSLYQYENEVIRPLGEERVHFALNCMAVSCPRLPRTPFRAATLEAALAAETIRFVDEGRNVMVDAERRKVRLSAIFDFYTGDFLAKSPSLIWYVNSHRSMPVPTGNGIEFIDYDWTVAAQILPNSK